MNEQDKKAILNSISDLKKQLLKTKIKKNSGETVSLNETRMAKKQIARMFTKLNESA